MSLPARTLGFAETDDFNVAFREQIDFLRQKVSLPTRTWRDISGGAHDRAFVVAGVEREEVLNDLRRSIDEAIAKGKSLQQFRRELDGIVAKHGWIGGAGETSRAWRARVIYETNVRTSYMAGRLNQMRDPATVALRPFWQYRHGETREPLRPRVVHLGWNGLVLRHDDPWWDKHYPPNGWLCSCGVRPLSKREMERQGLKLGKAPPEASRPVQDPKTGETVDVPEGVDFGWDHQPGDTWERGLVTPELQQPLTPAEAPRAVTTEPPLPSIPEPVKVPPAPAGRSAQSYVDDFLAQFGVRPGPNGAKVFRDPSGHAVVISEGMFRSRAGHLKTRRYNVERERQLPRLAEAIKNPDEVWIDWANDPTSGAKGLVRRHLRYDPEGGGLVIFEYVQGTSWSGVTALPPKLGSQPRTQETYLNRQRKGALVYRRPRK